MAMDMRQMMKQAQKMQMQMAKAQEELKTVEVQGSAGGGMVTVSALADGTFTGVTISPVVVDPEDVELLQDMVLAAINDALAKAAEESNARMSAVTGNMKIPGMPGLM